MVKLKAFTIIETLVSLTLVGVSIGVGFLILNTTSINGTLNHEVYFIAEETYQRVIRSEIIRTDQTIKKGKYEIELIVDYYSELEGLDALTIKVFENSKLLIENKHLLIVENEN